MPSEPSVWPVEKTGIDGPAILFLHGFMGSRNDWSEVTEQLSDDHVCFAPDLPGHGEHPARMIPEYQNVLIELDFQRQAWGVERLHLVGYSMGGRLALSYALQYPSHTASLNLLSASPGIDDGDARRQRVVADQLWAERFRTRPAHECLAAWYEQSVFSSLESKAALKADMIKRRLSRSHSGYADVLDKWGQGKVASSWSRLHELYMPVQVVAGKEDAIYRAHAERFRRLCARARVVEVEGAGHTVHLEQPEKLVMILEHFISTGK